MAVIIAPASKVTSLPVIVTKPPVPDVLSAEIIPDTDTLPFGSAESDTDFPLISPLLFTSFSTPFSLINALADVASLFIVDATISSLAEAFRSMRPRSPASSVPVFVTVPNTSSATMVAVRRPAASKDTRTSDAATNPMDPLLDVIFPAFNTSRPIK